MGSGRWSLGACLPRTAHSRNGRTLCCSVRLAAAVQRSLVAVRENGMPVLAVGFLDLVGFTQSSREWDAGHLERTLERFERDTALRVAAVGGRVGETLGGGVLLTTEQAATAVRLAPHPVAAHGVVGYPARVATGDGNHRQDVAAVHPRAGGVNREAPVGVAVEGEARIGTVLDNSLLEALEVG